MKPSIFLLFCLVALILTALARGGYWTPVRSTSVSDWYSTYRCENGGYGWYANTGNGYYGGLQFDHQTWVAHGGLRFGYNAHQASPWEQVLVASRLRYDGWPNCPNPPRLR